MDKPFKNEYYPDFVFPPGETLLEVLEGRAMTQAQLATRMGRPKKTINEIIKGKAAITHEMAIQLERALGVSADFWNRMESSYRTFLAKSEEEKRLRSEKNWLKQFPVKEMIDREWLPNEGKNKVSQIKALLNFFGVASPEQWEEGWGNKQFSLSTSVTLETQRFPTSAWIRQGEVEAAKIDCAKYNKDKLRAALPLLRALTLEPDVQIFVPQLIRKCAEIGIALVFLPGFKGVPISGVSLWLRPTKAMILLSLRYKSDDQLWFTFFHELGHILLHSKTKMFVEFSDQPPSKEEKEANDFSAEHLIPAQYLSKWLANVQTPSKEDVLAFSAELGISPGITVGRLQHIGKLKRTHLNDLKQRYKWSD